MANSVLGLRRYLLHAGALFLGPPRPATLRETHRLSVRMDGEFNTNLPSKEERIKVRQRRIEARNASKNDEARNGRGNEVLENAIRSKGQQQVADSLAHLDKKKMRGIEGVTNVRVAADWRESQRRDEEEKQRQERLHRLQEEAVRSGKQNAAVELRWSELLDQNMPQELHDEIESQKAACAEIIASKDTLIREFQLQLKAKDEEYVKSLKQQAQDIEDLLQRMRLEFKELQQEYELELEAIEDAFLTERDELLSANRAEIEGLFEKRREMELLYMDRKREREEQYQQEIEELLVRDAEEYNNLKIKLETDIQTLEQQLEEMRATYQLNTEKLEYNYRVLTERDNENSSTLAQLKRKQHKLKDALGTVVAKYHETDARDRKKNDELTEEYRRITKQYRDLQSKFRHFELADNRRFEEIWLMHEEDVNELVSKVLKADRVIHQQQLGWEWRAPDMSALLGTHEQSEAGNNEERDQATDIVASPTVKLPGAGEEDAEAVATLQNGVESALQAKPAGTTTVSSFKLKAMLELLAEEAGFLVDPKVKEALETMAPEEAELSRAESMLRALGVCDDRDVAALVAKFFVQPTRKRHDDDDDDEDIDEEDLDNDDPAAAALKQLKSLISPDAVISAVRDFVAESRHRAADKNANQASSRLAAYGRGVKDRARRLEERDFWNRLSDVVSDETFQVWGQLETMLAKYNDLLGQRASEIGKVQSLQDQNATIRSLLEQHLSAKVNDDLIVPPAATLRFPVETA